MCPLFPHSFCIFTGVPVLFPSLETDYRLMPCQVVPTIAVTPHQPADTQHYPDTVFVNGFSVNSSTYAASCAYARVRLDQPGTHQWSYEGILISYCASCSSALPYAQFTLHHPIAIETGFKDEYQNPFMLFAITGWLKCYITLVFWLITVES